MKKILIFGLLALFSCTQNVKVKEYGGTGEINLDTNERLVNITFKDANLWMLTKYDSTKAPSTYFFKEQSSYGIWQGTYIIKEK